MRYYVATYKYTHTLYRSQHVTNFYVMKFLLSSVNFLLLKSKVVTQPKSNNTYFSNIHTNFLSKKDLPDDPEVVTINVVALDNILVVLEYNLNKGFVISSQD